MFAPGLDYLYIATAMTRKDREMPTTQICRDCGEPFPYDPDADICRTCVVENLGDDLPDFGGAFDGFTVTSDADPGL